MKRFIAVLSGLLVLPAFAEVVPDYYYDDITDEMAMEYDDTADADDAADVAQPAKKTNAVVKPTAVSARTSGRVAASRTPATTAAKASTRTTNTSRAVTARTATNNAISTARSTATRVNRAAAAVRSTTPNSQKGVTSRRTNTSGANNARAALVQTDTVTAPLYTGRVGVRTNAGIGARASSAIRAATTSITTSDVSAASTATSMDELAQLTDFCKAQYAQCMDTFCNVLDDNQGRCSCSKNIKNYEKTEAALKAATEELQSVAQNIQYIGLTGRDIETLLTQTEAELKLQQTTDNSKLKNDLDAIRRMVVDVKTGTASSSATTSGISLDLSGLLDFSISSNGFDLNSLLGTTTSTSSITNQRGEQLYKTATARCKANVLNNCVAQGVDASVVTNSYDLEIDKQCMAYERNLTDANDNMRRTVSNAQFVLQKARLLVSQQKNSYDMLGCVNALDACMQDDYVCGSDYEYCLDPSGRYIVNGKIVSGSTPGIAGGNITNATTAADGLYSTWNYENNSKTAWGNGNVGEYITTFMKGDMPKTGTNLSMAEFLQNKIGYVDKNNVSQGMCMSVLNKCQNYTYTGSNSAAKYNPNNEVVKNYLERTLVQIKAAQDAILADYAENCIADVTSCLNQNSYSSYGYTTTYNNNGQPSDAAIRACASVIKTCQSVTGNFDSNNSESMYDWLNSALGTTLGAQKTACLNSNGTWASNTCTCGTAHILDSTTYKCTNVANKIFKDTTVGSEFTFAFDFDENNPDNKSILASAGCKTYTAQYWQNGNSLQTSNPFGGTFNECPSELASADQACYEFIKNLKSYELKNGTLTLSDGKNNKTFKVSTN